MPERKHIWRGLRFRLAAVYTAVFTLLLAGVSLLFRQTLSTSLSDQSRDDLEQSWAVVKANLRIEKNVEGKYHAVWVFDPSDAEENAINARVRSIIIIRDAHGAVLEESPSYKAVGEESVADIATALKTSQPVWREKTDESGVPYLLRASWLLDEERNQKFYVSIGESLADPQKLLTRFTLLCLGLIPLMIVVGSAMGWIFAGRALRPVLGIARTAQRISGSNLSLRIKSRQAGDEIDFLIRTFNQMIERLEINFNQVRQFSTDVSHELRTPITIVRGQLEVALFTAQTAEQYREAIVNSLDDIERLSQIVRALLLLSQAETGQVILQKQRLDLVALTRNTLEQFGIPAEEARVTLEFRPESPLCEGDFDRVQLERMLSNLVSNSLKFTPPGGHICVTVGCDPEEAAIRVEDTGKGIAREHLPHIFDRFYRVRDPGDQSSPEKGLGLGLSFVAWIVKAHNGRIEVDSEIGKGTTFRIHMPLTTANEPQAPPAPTDPQLIAASSRGDGEAS